MPDTLFPNNPTLNQTHTIGSLTWRWNGYAWVTNNSTLGETGKSGFEGFDFSGYSGRSGSSGYGGSSGYSGYSGYSGISGYSGRSGFSGFSGFSGYSGPSAAKYLFASSTSLTIGTGLKTFTDVPNNLGYTEGQILIAFNSKDRSLTGYVVAYDGGANTLDLQVTSTTGTGTYGEWYVNLGGSPGIQGFSGTSGLSGYGDSGYSGYTQSGYSGYSGISAFSGYSGYSGAAGSTGDVGYSGTSGTSGTSGRSGRSGLSGRIGYSGYSGYSGRLGQSGLRGYSGYSGSSGINHEEILMNSWNVGSAPRSGYISKFVFDTVGNDTFTFLIAGGKFTTAGGFTTNRIAMLKGTKWSSLGTGTNGQVSSVLLLNNNDVVVGGLFTTAGGNSANNVALWNGSSWSALGAGVSGVSGVDGYTGEPPYVTNFSLESNGNIVVGGDFNYANGIQVNAIARYASSTWYAFGTGMTRTGGGAQVNATVIEPNGNIVACGIFDFAGGVAANNIARWSGTSWSAIGTGLNNSTLALVRLSSGDLIAGGFFTTAGGQSANCIARWDGTSWSALGTGMSAGVSQTSVNAIAVLPSGDIIAGGNFATAGGVSASNIAKWDGSSWSALGSGLNGQVRALYVLLNGDLIAGGDFSVAGGVGANYIARWNGTSWSRVGNGLNDAVWAMGVRVETVTQRNISGYADIVQYNQSTGPNSSVINISTKPPRISSWSGYSGTNYAIFELFDASTTANQRLAGYSGRFYIAQRENVRTKTGVALSRHSFLNLSEE